MTTPGKNITIIDTTGLPHEISATTVYTTLAIGWIAFGLAIIFNILYYALHPSKVVWTKIIFVLHVLIMCHSRWIYLKSGRSLLLPYSVMRSILWNVQNKVKEKKEKKLVTLSKPLHNQKIPLRQYINHLPRFKT